MSLENVIKCSVLCRHSPVTVLVEWRIFFPSLLDTMLIPVSKTGQISYTGLYKNYVTGKCHKMRWFVPQFAHSAKLAFFHVLDLLLPCSVLWNSLEQLYHSIMVSFNFDEKGKEISSFVPPQFAHHAKFGIFSHVLDF